MTQQVQDRILFLIDELKLPMTQEKAASHLDKLSDREQELLLMMYEELKTYQDGVDRAAYNANPEEYEKIRKKYEKDLAKIDRDYTAQLVNIEEAADQKMEQIVTDLAKSSDSPTSNQLPTTNH